MTTHNKFQSSISLGFLNLSGNTKQAWLKGGQTAPNPTFSSLLECKKHFPNILEQDICGSLK